MHFLWRIISFIFRSAWRLLCFIRDLVLNIAFLIFVLLLLGASYGLSGKGNKVDIPQDGVFVFDLSGTVVDKPKTTGPLSLLADEILGKQNPAERENSLFAVVEKINSAKEDPQINAMILQLDNFVGSDLPALEYIGKALNDFRASGKTIYAFGQNYSQSQYYLASFADNIVLAPQGEVSMQGMSATNFYFEDLLKRYDAKMYIYRVGTHKAAVEPYMRNNMSPEAKENTARWLNSIWNSYSNQIASNRNIKTSDILPEVTEYYKRLESVSGSGSSYALNNKFVDRIANYAELEDELKDEFGSRKESFKQVSFYDYLPVTTYTSSTVKIAVVVINGAITDGYSENGNAGATTIVSQLKKARNNKNVKALVLRVNSPGGGVQASEAIRNEVAMLRKANIPVVVSMGSMAASGGYWVSTPADYIVASPNTLTGSIGIFGMIPNIEKSLKSMGIHVDGVSTSPLASAGLLQEIPDDVSKILQLRIENGYQSFISLVAESRKLSLNQVDQIAQGQVWSGLDAKEKLLVDQLGDFDDALQQAVKLAKLEPDASYKLDWLASEPSVMELIFGSFNVSVQAYILQTIQANIPPALSQVLLEVNRQTVIIQNPDITNRYIYCVDCGYSQTP